MSSEEPTWLDEAYVRKILNAHTKDQLEVLHSFTKSPATVKGENFASCMVRLNVNYSTKNEPTSPKDISLIVKSRLNNEMMAQIEEEFSVFEREAQVYKFFIPEAEKLLRSANDETVFGPRAIFVDDRVIVQENVKLLGYSILDVKQGLDLEECRMILKKLAKFHAVSMVLYKRNPEMFRHHLPSNVSENPSPLHDFYVNSIATCIEYCRTNPKLAEYVPKLEQFGEHIIPKMINVFSRNQTDRYHVLNHGDVWVNNVMFRKNSASSIQDVIFVDYQEGFFGSPGIDWNYFIFSSWKTEVFRENFDQLIEVYHSALSEVLLKLQHDERIPTIEDVQKEILNKGYHGLATATCLLPVLINEHDDLADAEIFILETDDAKENRRTVYSNPNFGARLEVFLDYFKEKGIL